MFGEAGGIRIIFTPPDDVEEEKEVEQLQFSTPMKVVSTPPTLPALDFGHDEDEDLGTDTAPFSFGRAPVVERPSLNEKQVPQQTSPRQSTPPINMTASAATPRSASRTASPPSSIPRLSTRVSTNSPPRPVLACKRPSGTPSFIPQPIASSSPPWVATPKAKGNPSPPKYFRQPLRKGSMIPLGSDSNTKSHSMNNFIDRSSQRHSQTAIEAHGRWRDRSASETNMKSVDLRNESISPAHSPRSQPVRQPSNTSSPALSIPSTLSFSSLSNFIPVSWSSRPTETAPVSSRSQGKPSFVSREQQLLRLKRRMDGEERMAMPTHTVCRRCTDQPVVDL